MRIVIAGGGTGGHLFPGIALAEALRERGHEVHFVGTAQGLEARLLPEQGWPLTLIHARGLARVSLAARLRFLAEAPRSVADAVAVLLRLRPDRVVGVGGYASGPVVLLAALAGLPTVVLEQNSVPGVTNRLLGRVVDHVVTSFPASEAAFPPAKVRPLGNPVRRSIVAALCEAGAARAAAGPLRLLVLGGSLGAHALNVCCAEAAPRLAALGLEVVHQTGPADADSVRQAYAAAGLPAEVHPFITDMATRYAAADVVLCRAGATTLAELAIAGRPAVLVPFPFATYDHQTLNARAFEAAGAAVCRPQAGLEAASLTGLLGELARDPERRRCMAVAMRGLGRPEAARHIAALVETAERRVRP
jgi:UDP-N-acetylglucosamine--N-acetylmuramyl-(pentapeptide) pyrophosphoryl-undecaprenol N-acetylglucosamine transferase